MKLTLLAEFRKETVVLVVGKRTETETERFSATTSVLLRPGGSDYAIFKFEPFTSHDETGLKILAKVTKDLMSVQTEKIELESVNLAY